MLEIKFTTAYKKSYKLMKKRGKDLTLLDDVIDALRQGQVLEERYRDHELKGKFKGFRECHIQPDWLLIYYQTDTELYLYRTGTHADLFGL